MRSRCGRIHSELIRTVVGRLWEYGTGKIALPSASLELGGPQVSSARRRHRNTEMNRFCYSSSTRSVTRCHVTVDVVSHCCPARSATHHPIRRSSPWDFLKASFCRLSPGKYCEHVWSAAPPTIVRAREPIIETLLATSSGYWYDGLQPFALQYTTRKEV